MLFLSKIILLSPKQIKSLTSLLFKLLWNYFPFEHTKKLTLYLLKSDGGIALPSIGLKTPKAYLWKLSLILQFPNSHKHF